MNQDIVNQIEKELRVAGLLEEHPAGMEIDLSKALEDLASTGKLLSAWEPTSSGLGKRFKIKVFSKLKAIVINVLNPYTRKQEQYNKIMARAVIELLKKSK